MPKERSLEVSSREDGFAITHRLRDGELWIELRGELDMASVPELDRVLAGIPAERTAVLDLGALEFIDSAGMRAVLLGHWRLGGRLRLIPPPEHVLRLFCLAGPENVLPFDLRTIARRAPSRPGTAPRPDPR